MFKQHLITPFHPDSVTNLERRRKGYSKTERSIDVSQAITKILSKLTVDFMHNALSQNINIMC